MIIFLWAFNVLASTIISLVHWKRNNNDAAMGWGLAAFFALGHFFNNLFKIITGV